MKTLIVEDDFVSRLLLQEILKPYGPVHIAVNGREAVTAVDTALQTGEPYQLVCLDIMMPEMDGHEALQKIRDTERARGIGLGNGAKIFMTTALDRRRNIIQAFRDSCDVYLCKPIDRAKLLEELHTCQLI